MDIYVFDKSFNLLGIIDYFSSLIWKREHYFVGTFELHAFIDEHSLSLLQKGNILIKDDSPEEAVEIGTIKLDDENSGTIVVEGLSIDNFLDERFVWGSQSKNGTAEEVMKSFVINNCISPTDIKRVVPNLIVSAPAGISTPANEVNSYGAIAQLMIELAVKYDVGWRIIFDLTKKKYIFDVYVGKDSSINQTVNPHVIFSAEYENVLNQTYVSDDASYKNMALIAGQGEGSARKLAILNNELTGFQRREIFVDARDISAENSNGNPISDSEYIKLLEERGKSKLVELQTIQTFESGISILSNLIYKQDFDLGDKVTIENNKWGLTINTRITTIEEIYENNAREVRVNFGSNVPTIIDKIKRAVR